MKINKDAVLDAVASLMRRRFDVAAERNKQFVWGDATVIADLYLPAPLHCIVQFDDTKHCTRQRAGTITSYPPNTPLNFDVHRYLADQAPGSEELARADAAADLLPSHHGFNPTVRVRADELAEQAGPLEERVEAILAKRFALHAGTVFQQMLDTAGAKPHRTHNALIALGLGMFLFLPVTLRAAQKPASVAWDQKVDPWVFETATAAPSGETEFILFLADQADLRGAAPLKTKTEKGAFIVRQLTEMAQRTQGSLLKELDSLGVEYQSFWIANMIWVRGDLNVVQRLAARADVARVSANPRVRLQEPVGQQKASVQAIAAIEPNIIKINAANVWSLGYTGQTVVVAGEDTGYQWDHAALKPHYRGWNGTTADHNYNWHDAIHTGGGSCGANNTAPCDDNGHGTHTMGTMVGDDGAGNQIGVAPGAKWIGCRNMDQGNGTPATYTECFQWFIAPTDLNGLNPDPSKAPDVINNSWSCPPSEGCTDPNVLKTVIENVRAAGITVVVSAGNSGPGCSTVSDPAALYAASLTVGATDNNDAIASFSSRGPVTIDGSNRLKPNVTAPGVSVRSSYPPSTYAILSGTSMAGPHVAGAVALLISAHPELKGQPDTIQTLLEQFAVPLTNGVTCGGISGTQVPNNTFGWGRIDVLAALGLADSDGDGMSNYPEILAGTNPRDPASLLRITAIATNGADYLVSFTTATNKHYRLERADGLTSPNWTTISNNITGTGSVLQLPDPGATSNTQRFYRVFLLP